MSGKEYEQVAKEESVEVSTEVEAEAETEEGGCCGTVRGNPMLLRAARAARYSSDGAYMGAPMWSVLLSVRAYLRVYICYSSLGVRVCV